MVPGSQGRCSILLTFQNIGEHARVMQPVQPGRKLYPSRCKECGGKARVEAPTEAALVTAPFRCLRQLDPFFGDPQPRFLI
jgi:hypothetical protein